jgi:WD40 repeat protein
VRQFTDVGNFVDFCYLHSLWKLAIAKENRTIIFYDLRTHTKLVFYISATIDDRQIPRLSLTQSKDFLRKGRNMHGPLFNIPASIESISKTEVFCVGDDSGLIEFFRLSHSARDYAWETKKLAHRKVHKDAVTQISYIESYDSLISSSDDGTLVMWQFSEKDSIWAMSCSFTDPQRLSIPSFVFDLRTHAVVYTTSGHCLGCWKVFSTQHIVADIHGEMISAIGAVQVSDEATFVVTVSESNFFATYTTPSLELTGSWYMSVHHALCSPTATLFLREHLYLVGSYLSCWHCESGDSDGLPPHRHPLVGALANDIFMRILSCDEMGNIHNWDSATANKGSTFSFPVEDAIVSCFQLDDLNRRVVMGYSSGAIKVIAVSSGSVLTEVSPDHIENGCNWVIFAKIRTGKFIAVANGRKQIVVLEDLPGNRVKLHRILCGHREQVSRVVNLKKEFLLSIGMGKELFLWDAKSSHPNMMFRLLDEPCAACDLASPKNFIVGDVTGMLHFMALDVPRPLMSIDPFEIKGRVPITAISPLLKGLAVVVANRAGYLRFVEVQQGMIPRSLYRTHVAAVDQISISEKFQFLVTSGRDQEVRAWFIQPFRYMGELGKHRKWNVEDPNTWPSSPCEIDPRDFAEQSHDEPTEIELPHFLFDPSQSDAFDPMDFSEDRSLIGRSTAYEPITSPDFSAKRMVEVMDDLDDLCAVGRKHARMGAAFAVKSAIPRRSPEESSTDLGLLIHIPEMDADQNRLRRLRELTEIRFSQTNSTKELVLASDRELH